jgi:arylsulfatase A-like enzyme
MTRISRRELFTSGLAAASLVTSRQAARAAGPSRPNIIFILADDLGYADVGCYGQQKIRTPAIDRLAAEGMRFTDAYAGCTVCAPSRSTLMTGLHMGHTPIRNNGMGSLLPEEPTVAEMLKQAGYRCGAFGKWGLGEEPETPGVPTKKGFETFFGYLNQSHAHFYYPEFLYENDRKYPFPGNANGRRTTYSHDAIAGKTLDFIRANRSRPFFCYAAWTLPHWELLVPEDSLAEYRGKFEERPFIDPRNHYARQDESRAAYAAMITRMDRDVGRLVGLLKELDLDRNTIVFFSSDNGPAMPLVGDDYFRSKGPLRGHKENLYEGGIRVPMIVRWPGRVPAGAVSDLQWAFWDFFATAAELAGGKTPRATDGISVVPTLLGSRTQRRHEYLYWELPRRDARDRWAYRREIPRQAIRMGNWKAVRPEPDGRLELYNLARDPGETANVASANPEVLARMEALLKTARTTPRPAVPFEDRWRKAAP